MCRPTSTSDRRRSRLVPTGLLGIWGPHWLCRNEAIAIRHFDLRQTLGVKDVAFLDNAVPIVQKRDDRINLVRGERSRFIRGHRAVDIVPRYGRIRVVAYSGLFSIFKRAAMRVAGTARHQTLDCPPFPVLPMAYRTLFGKNLGAFLGGSAPRRKFLSLRADDEVKALYFFLAQGR